jgi:hypothetical protein
MAELPEGKSTPMVKSANNAVADPRQTPSARVPAPKKSALKGGPSLEL